MSEIALSVRGLTKEYQILHNLEKHDRVTDAVADTIKGVFRKKESETFRALQDISFDVKKGEVLGIVGRNGAGKSTLLKILSRITEPSSGEIHLYGRVGSLLEVGTGFHPELTGRENIYLNGAILGMRKREIQNQFDEIVDFAEVEKFLDTPVKRYSSGMYVRLAFAVAAHLNPEILIIDEVLAVGDAQFQKKCLGKMQDVNRKGGKTILFVSHNMSAVASLCNRALFLEQGKLILDQPTSAVLAHYAKSQQEEKEAKGRSVDRSKPFLANVQTVADVFKPNEPKVIEATIEPNASFDRPLFVSGEIRNDADEMVAHFDSRLTEQWFRPEKRTIFRTTVSHPWLKPGRYSVNLFICTDGFVVDEFTDACSFSVTSELPYGGACDEGAISHSLVLADFAITTRESGNLPVESETTRIEVLPA